jgi:crotonobetainyl-CoA:carnitine CoA-transferase CaiB-like acyl-CoA transferase
MSATASSGTLNPLLAGVRVLDLTRLLPGPLCTLYLAQMGADVIKIEEPGGEYGRDLKELFAQVNRGKKSVTLNLREPEQVAQFKALVADADIVVESFRPGVMDRLGCGYEALRKINPRLVYAALTGYGYNGPYRDMAGHDTNYLSLAGVLDQTGAAAGPPAMCNLQIADVAGGGLTCVVGILAALFGARASGVGTFVDVAMLDGSLALQISALATVREQGRGNPRGADFLSGALPNYSLYECKDGKHIALGALEHKFFAKLCAAVNRPELAERPLVPGKESEPVRAELIALFKTRTRDEWTQTLLHADACLTPVLTMPEVLANEQVKARGMVLTDDDGKPVFNLPIKFSHAVATHGPTPAAGAHNEAALGVKGKKH